MGFVGPGPLCLALILLAAGVIGAVVCAKDKRKPKKAKKAKKAKKGKKEEDAQVE
jgi:mannose/fructose/N-acetylgalactosamine-specific phosphotransferase system component IIC